MTRTIRAWITAITGALLVAAWVLHLATLTGWSKGALFAGAVIAGVPTAIKAWQALRAKAFSIDLLVTIAVVGALIIGEYMEAAVVAFLFVFGAWLEARTLERTRRSLRDLIDMAPQEAQVLRDGETVTLPVDDIVVGDHVLVQSGGKVAVDGTVLSGRGLVNEATITGEPVPADKQPGDTVYSGTILENGFFTVVAEQVGDDTTFAQIIELVEEAQESKTKAQQFLDKFASIYTPAIVGLSVLVLAFTRDVEFALTFLVIACPGALVISTPVSMVAGLGNGARHGVLMKGGDALERLSKLDTLVVDKTGTLTMGRPEVTEVHVSGSESELELLGLVARLELASEHPLGRTIVEEAEARGLDMSEQPDDVEVIVGGGIRGTVEGRDVVVGTRRVLGTIGVEVPQELETHAVRREQEGNTVVFAVLDGVLAGTVAVADSIRPGVAEALARLRERGISKFVMLTGDNRHTAKNVADQLGIDEVRAELLPQHKVREVEALQAQGRRVGMIGDGINDAPAIATADAGIAMGAGTDVSIQTADVILMGNRFDQLVHAFSLSKATVRNMKQNTVIALGTVVLLLVGVLMQEVHMAGGMLAHQASVIIVIINAVRLVRYRSRTDSDDVSAASTHVNVHKAAGRSPSRTRTQ